MTLSLMLAGAAALTTGCAVRAAADEESSELRSRHNGSDAETKAAIERAAEGAVYVSESDDKWTYISADGHGIDELTPAVVIDKLGNVVQNREHEQLRAKAAAFEGFFEYDNCDENSYPGPAECAKDKILHDALKANLKKVKVFYVAPYENPSGDGTPTIFVVGFTPEGNIGGVYTTAVWT